MPELEIRNATSKDCQLILNFVRELAIFENAEAEVVATIDDIRQTIFHKDSNTHSLICEVEGKAVGFAVYFYNYSTWLGRKGLYLEDLYISPDYRHQGFGKKLLKMLARIAIENDCGRFEWSVLDWNEQAIRFYHSLGAEPLDEWITYRLSGQSLKDLAV